jgi:hypothetical protein
MRIIGREPCDEFGFGHIAPLLTLICTLPDSPCPVKSNTLGNNRFP